MPPTVTLIIRGLIAVFVNPQKTLCTVGVLEDSPPDHKLSIIFRKPNAGGEMEEYERLEPPNIAYNLELDVQKISQDQITFRKVMKIDRQSDPTAENIDSFSWVVDLENLELYGRKIRARRSGFTPILTFTNGELFAFQISKNKLFTQRGIFSTKKFGFVGNVIGAEFVLDTAESTAVFRNGIEEISIPDPAQSWEIEINNDAEEHPFPAIITDANHYYKAVGLQLSEQERILFSSIAQDPGGPPIGPEAACFSGFMSKSEPE